MTGEVATDFHILAKTDEHPELNNWPWYADNSELKCKRHKAQLLLDHLNSIEPDRITFTKGEEQENKLAALDLESNVKRKKKGLNSMSVTGKPIQTLP